MDYNPWTVFSDLKWGIKPTLPRYRSAKYNPVPLQLSDTTIRSYVMTDMIPYLRPYLQFKWPCYMQNT